MKLADAKHIIYTGTERPHGFRVQFERKEGSTLRGDCFPARDEPPIELLGEAFELANAFAARTVGKCLHIAVIDARTWQRVSGFVEIENRT